MKFIKTVLMSTIVVCLCFYSLALIFIQSPVKTTYWVGEMITIKKYIVHRFNGQPKIIVAGGSSTLFGIDGEYASNLLKVPVINFGLVAGFALNKALKVIGLVAEKDDLVVLTLEPTYFECDQHQYGVDMSEIIGWDHDYWLQMTIPEKINALSYVSPSLLVEMIIMRFVQEINPDFVANRLEARDQSKVLAKFASRTKPDMFEYSAFNLDNYGAILATDGAKFNGPESDLRQPTYMCNKTELELSQFIANMKQKGVRVVFGNTPYLISPPDKAIVNDWQGVEHYFRENFYKLACFIDTRQELIYDRKYFFNTNLHLNAEGRRLRTQKLLSAIQNNAYTSECIRP